MNYRGLNFNFLKLAQLLINGDTESNPGPTQNDCKFLRDRSKKVQVFKGTPNKCDLSQKTTFNFVSDPKVQNIFFNAIQIESNHSSIDRVIFCTYENLDYEIHKDLMSTFYFPVSKRHLTGNHMKESPNNNFEANVKKTLKIVIN